MQDLAGRLKNRVQLTTDGHRVYLDAVESAFGSGIDYSMLVKLYGNDAESEARYSPAECIGTRVIPIIGQPNPKYISTSYVELHQTLRVTPAMEAGIADHVWTTEEIVSLLEPERGSLAA